MNVGIKIDCSWSPIGRGEYLDSFFSIIAYYLENKKWGSKHPKVMKQLYDGEVIFEDAKKTIEELENTQIVLDNISKLDNLLFGMPEILHTKHLTGQLIQMIMWKL